MKTKLEEDSVKKKEDISTQEKVSKKKKKQNTKNIVEKEKNIQPKIEQDNQEEKNINRPKKHKPTTKQVEKIDINQKKSNKPKEVIHEEDMNKEEKDKEKNVEKDNNYNNNEKLETNNIKLEEEKSEENDESEDISKPKMDGLHKYTIIIVIISTIFLIALCVFSTIFALVNKSSDKIIKGIFINGIEVGGLTKQEATSKINEIFINKSKQNIILKHNDYETSISPEQIEMNFGINESIDMAYNVGRTGKLLKDNYTIINANISKLDVKPSYGYNKEVLEEFINQTEGNLPDVVKQSNYWIDGNKLFISKGQKGITIQKEELKKQIVEASIQTNSDTIIIEIPIIEKQPDVIDIEKIYNEIYKKPKDAYYTQNPFTIYPHEDGIDFGITMEEAKGLLNNNDTEITIPLKITKPNKTTNQIGTEAFPDLLATYSTTFSTKNVNRTTNIRLASNKVNGVVLLPQEQFSYNKVVGQRTQAAGYKTAAVYVGGKVEEGIGGGICQVSSTLYNTALRANLEIVKRYNHRFATGYVPLSTDATVSWGGPEFIFKNSRKYPIKIVSTVNGGKITITIYGHKQENEYEVVIQSQTLQTIPMQTIYKTNDSLPKGTTKTVQKGHGGYKSRAYRILKQNGTVISKQLLSTDTYAQLPTIIEQNP